MNSLFRRLAPAVTLGIPLAAFAQPTTTDAVNPSPSASTLQYRSAFADDWPCQDVPLAERRAVNDAEAVSGGMGQMPMAAPPSPTASTMPAHEHHQVNGARK
jgi:hypothetical protein